MVDFELDPLQLKKFFANIKDDIEKSGNEAELASCLESLNLSNEMVEDFWPKLFTVSQDLSKESTKVAMAFSSDPVPQGGSVLKGIYSSALILSTLYFKALPSAKDKFGDTCWSEIRAWTSSLFTSLVNFIDAVSKGPSKVKVLCAGTGAVWEICETVVLVPQNNRLAVAKQVTEALKMVEDALLELQNHGEDEDELEENISLVLSNCLALCKTAKATLRTASKALAVPLTEPEVLNTAQIREMDALAGKTSKFSGAVDDLVAAFYELSEEQNNARPAEEEAKNIRDLIKTTLELVSAYSAEKADFLLKANEHNYAKFCKAIEKFPPV